MGSKWTLKRLVEGVWSGFTWLRIGIAGDCCECSDEPLGSGATELVIQHNIPANSHLRISHYVRTWNIMNTLLFKSECRNFLTSSFKKYKHLI
jgi:hypothetical protein